MAADRKQIAQDMYAAFAAADRDFMEEHLSEDFRFKLPAIVHQFGPRFLAKQFLRVAIEEQIHPSNMDAKMIGLGEEDA